MKTEKILLIIMIIAGLHSCTCSRNKKDKSNTSETTQLKDVQTIKNDRYNFSFELPVNWKASDVSDNGDGYTIQTGDNEVDFRIYAQQLIGSEESDEYEKTEDFIFEDGKKGKKCYYNENEYFIFRNNKNTQIAFYLSAGKSWMEKNSDVLNSIAKSMKFTHEDSNF